MNFKKLFKTGKIAGISLRNRIVMAPMGPGSMQNPDGGFSERLRDYFEARAKGGVGLIMTGATGMTRVTRVEARKAGSTLFLDMTYVGGASELCDAIHQHGSKICIQLTPGEGRLFSYSGEIPLSASDGLRGIWDHKVFSRAATKEEIGKIIRDYGNSARLAKKAGFDAIEIRAYGGYFVDQFMSSIWNNRRDEYGGDLDGRLRFLMEAISEVRSVVGKDYPIIVKFTPDHCMEGGRDLDEGLKIAKRLEEAGVDALHVDKGCYEVWYQTIPPVHMPLGNQLDIAEAVKGVVNIPVISNGNLGIEPQLAEKSLEDGKADFVALGRPLLADPDWPKKVEAGMLDDIRPCIGCMSCGERVMGGRYVSCAVNPQTGMEKRYQLGKANQEKRVLIVGGGPAGMEAARVAALRGHKVTLFEKKEVLGGALRVASAAPFKKRMEKLVNYYSFQLTKLKVNVELNKDMDADAIMKEKADIVVIAAGARPYVPENLSETTKDHIYTAERVLLETCNLKQLGERIVIIGGGEIGCETALHLAEGNPKMRILIVELMEKVLSGTHVSVRQLLGKRLNELGIQIQYNSKLVGVNRGRVFLEEKGIKKEISADSVILATGYRSNTKLLAELEGKITELYSIGDCNMPRRVLEAVWEGFHLARMI